jgi:succinate-semialdehyde dehydrogenase/glutarate-semialdehyde dehydrogenase
VFESVNPATGEVFATYEPHDHTEVDRRLDRALEAFMSWRDRSFADRAAVLHQVADQLDDDRDTHAELMTKEMGKPITAARAEAEKCAWVCRHYADHAAEYLATEDIPTDAPRSYVRYDPLGPVLAVMPWNFPYWQVFRFAAPSLMAGNVGLLKHASNVPGCALAIEDLFVSAGAGDAFQVLLIGSDGVEKVVADDRVVAATVTGSERAGASVAGAAGREIKPTVLELGGSDPFIVLADADVEPAIATAAQARLINNGQSCIAAKRFIVDRSVADRFTDGLVDAMEAAKVGDPLDEATEVGPLAREDLLDELHDQVQRSVKDGSVLRTGGERLDRPGYFYAPTLLDHVTPAHAAGCEETFGPVAAVIRVDGEDEAVAAANSTPYGLGASLWTQNTDRAEQIVRRIDAGCVFVNDMVKSDPRLPFGGVKRSGYGRELGAPGIRAFANTKTISFA